MDIINNKFKYLIIFIAITTAWYSPSIREKSIALFHRLAKIFEENNTTNNEMNENYLKLFSKKDLKLYDGTPGSKGLYIAIMGSVYDVEKGKQHYGPGGSYHFFAGKDASVSFISGEFEKESSDIDDVLSMTPQEILSLNQWKQFYDKDYILKGKLIGRFYDSKGQKTIYFLDVETKLQEGIAKKLADEKNRDDFPPCNAEWSADVGTTIWCTKKSGGKDRNWIGFPRKYYEAGNTDFRCACIHEDNLHLANIKEFEGCDSRATKCTYQIED